MSSAETNALLTAESGLASKPEAPKRRLGLVVALALGSFALGATVATAAKSGVLARTGGTATSLSACDGRPLAVGDAVELTNINAAPALNGKTGVIIAINGGTSTIEMDGSVVPKTVRKVPSVKVKASGCPAIDPEKQAWTNPICMDGMPFVKNGEFMYGITRTKLCSGWCGVSSDATQAECIVGDEVKQKLDACCAGFQCNRAGLPKCKF